MEGTEKPIAYDGDGAFISWGDCVPYNSSIRHFLDKCDNEYEIVFKELNLFKIENIKIGDVI